MCSRQQNAGTDRSNSVFNTKCTNLAVISAGAAFGLLSLLIIVGLCLKTKVQIANRMGLLIKDCFVELNIK